MSSHAEHVTAEFLKVRPRLLIYALSLTRDRDRAEDLVQDAFVRAAEQADLDFLDITGRPIRRKGRRKGDQNSGAPSVLCAYGWADADVLAGCGLSGQFVPLRLPRSVVVLALPGPWRDEVLAWLRRHGTGPVALAEIYRAFAQHPKAARNPNYRAKIRQVLQQGPFRRVARGQWECAA